MLDALKSFNADRVSTEELVVFLSEAEPVLAKFAEFQSLGLEAPEWLEAKVRHVRREVRVRCQDQIEQRIAKAKLALEGLQTPQERKAKLRREIEELQALQDVG